MIELIVVNNQYGAILSPDDVLGAARSWHLLKLGFLLLLILDLVDQCNGKSQVLLLDLRFIEVHHLLNEAVLLLVHW